MKKVIFLISTFLYSLFSVAQDAQYSQFYANALYLSPAFAGAEQNSRAILATRYQWPGLKVSYLSTVVSADHYIDRYRSGIGMIVQYDLITASTIQTSQIGLMYAYQFNLSKKLTVRPALQLSYLSKSIDQNKLTFGAQYTNDGFVGGSTQENFSSPRISQLDVSSGGILYSSRYWIGFTLNHMNTPDQSFLKGDDPLPMKTSLFAGYNFSFTPDWRKRHINPDEEKSISPTLLYKMQGSSDQLDIGLYGRYNTLQAGIWYRGLPVKVYKPERSNHDAIIFLIGIIHSGFNIGYSYDLTISRLTVLSGGSHELTLSYSVAHKKKRRIQKKLPCPKF